MADLEVDLFYSFRSPWSYLATPRLFDWTQQYALTVRLRPVYPIAIRTPEFFSQVHPLWPRYFRRDLTRVAEFLDLPCVWPDPDPVVSEPGPNGRPIFPAEQPYIYRLTNLGILAEERGQGLAFTHAVSALIWGGTRQWHLGDHLANAVAGVGLDLPELDEESQRRGAELATIVEQNQDDHLASGHWGVPTCVFDGEPFFGQDRLDVLLWRLRQAGLVAR